MRRWIFIGFLLGTTSLNAQRVLIQLNLAMGKTYSHDQKSKSVVLQTVNGKLSQTTVEMSAKTNYYIQSVHDSVYNMMVTYQNLVTKTNTSQGETISVSDGSKQDIVSKVFQAFVNKPFSLLMSKTGRVLEIHSDMILSSAVNQIDGLPQQQKEILLENLKKNFGGNAIKGNFEMLTAIYPSTRVGVNDSWSTGTQLQSMTMIDLNGDYILKAIQPDYFRIHGEIDMIAAKQDSALKIDGIPLYYDLSGKMKADMVLDKTTGWINSATISQSLNGTIKFLDSEQVPGGMDVPASISTEMSLGENSRAVASLTAQEVIQRYIEVSGGEKFLNGLKATKGIAEGTYNGDTLVVTILKVVPFKTYMKYETKHNGIIESIYNNGKLIIKKDGKTIPVVDSSGLEDLQVQSFLLGDMAYQKLGYKMDLIPSDEDSTYRVQLTSPKGRITIKNFSKKTGFLTKAMQANGTTSFFYDYQNVDGFLVNKRETTINQQGNPDEIRITNFTLNPEYDPSIFNF